MTAIVKPTHFFDGKVLDVLKTAEARSLDPKAEKVFKPALMLYLSIDGFSATEREATKEDLVKYASELKAFEKKKVDDAEFAAFKAEKAAKLEAEKAPKEFKKKAQKDGD